MDELKQQCRQILNDLARNYLVQDLVPDMATFLFLLESPHVQELKFGAPVSGSSGASMTKHLFGDKYEKYALGILIKKNCDEQLNRPALNKVGLMNVCQVPMQAAAYDNRQLVEQHHEFFRALEGVRSTNQKTIYPAPLWNVVQEVIAESLRRKLERLKERPLHIVPCGRFAQKFFRLANVRSEHWQIIDGVPHPSYNGWSKSEYQMAVNHLKHEFSR